MRKLSMISRSVYLSATTSMSGTRCTRAMSFLYLTCGELYHNTSSMYCTSHSQSRYAFISVRYSDSHLKVCCKPRASRWGFAPHMMNMDCCVVCSIDSPSIDFTQLVRLPIPPLLSIMYE